MPSAVGRLVSLFVSCNFFPLPFHAPFSPHILPLGKAHVVLAWEFLISTPGEKQNLRIISIKACFSLFYPPDFQTQRVLAALRSSPTRYRAQLVCTCALHSIAHSPCLPSVCGCSESARPCPASPAQRPSVEGFRGC